jgi:hypothetical protein
MEALEEPLNHNVSAHSSDMTGRLFGADLEPMKLPHISLHFYSFGKFFHTKAIWYSRFKSASRVAPSWESE